eukprot:CAMPEP_0167742926 /NCGR_PEP_ID=MMETSP0110_2-20121227/1719_1 /TAXON_ID=629695 /ORGANISM="Gymnochlora sp., Strain CCMP2014" /LENGTH=124 /DNA_ID=CAMNT_0007627215 /DNA_START=48 /DNA_END=422 /DNA_ORIENTATION=+
MRSGLRRMKVLRETKNTVTRGFAQPGYVPPKNHAKVWLSDKGAYPIMFIIGSAATMMTVFLGRMVMKAPQLTWDKERRGMTIDEGTHETAPNAEAYFNHPIRRFGQKRYHYFLTHTKADEAEDK